MKRVLHLSIHVVNLKEIFKIIEFELFIFSFLFLCFQSSIYSVNSDFVFGIEPKSRILSPSAAEHDWPRVIEVMMTSFQLHLQLGSTPKKKSLDWNRKFWISSKEWEEQNIICYKIMFSFYLLAVFDFYVILTKNVPLFGILSKANYDAYLNSLKS